jgi:glycosyltransferase involved in cell wall biosynthesis
MDGVNILLADTPQAFANHIFTLLSEPEIGIQLGRAGRKLVEAKYDWKHCLSSVENFYQTLLAKSPAARLVSMRSPCGKSLQ